LQRARKIDTERIETEQLGPYSLLHIGDFFLNRPIFKKAKEMSKTWRINERQEQCLFSSLSTKSTIGFKICIQKIVRLLNH
jgi:hypothetical protein